MIGAPPDFPCDIRPSATKPRKTKGKSRQPSISAGSTGRLPRRWHSAGRFGGKRASIECQSSGTPGADLARIARRLLSITVRATTVALPIASRNGQPSAMRPIAAGWDTPRRDRAGHLLQKVLGNCVARGRSAAACARRCQHCQLRGEKWRRHQHWRSTRRRCRLKKMALPRPCGRAPRPCARAPEPCGGAPRPRGRAPHGCAEAVEPCGTAPHPSSGAPDGRGGVADGWCETAGPLAPAPAIRRNIAGNVARRMRPTTAMAAGRANSRMAPTHVDPTICELSYVCRRKFD